jgi:hypothetical protein
MSSADLEAFVRLVTQSHRDQQCLMVRMVGIMASATMLSLQLARFMSTSMASSKGS